MDGHRWETPFGDPVTQLDCPKCGKRLADVADLGPNLALVDLAELRSGRTRETLRPQQVYTAAGSTAYQLQMTVGPPVSPLWRFGKCKCGATPVARSEQLLAKVRQATARGEHRVRLD